jgi:xanthine dehydrogenase accessory factor
VPSDRLPRLTCPIGIAGIKGKEPGAIAVAVAAQLLEHRERAATGAENERTARA